MDKEVGKRLLAIRRRTGLSQRQLGREAGVANATISQIESGRLNPTVSMLKKILDGVPISLSEFFSDDSDIEQKIFYRAGELVEIAEGGVSFRQVGSNLRNSAIQLLEESYEPGASTGRHALSHEGEECGIILSGRLQVDVGDQSEVLKSGDAYYFKSDQPHRFQNPGREKCRLVSACTPPSF